MLAPSFLAKEKDAENRGGFYQGWCRTVFSVGIIVVEERAETPLLREALKLLGKK
jgi:hypothetical protein